MSISQRFDATVLTLANASALTARVMMELDRSEAGETIVGQETSMEMIESIVTTRAINALVNQQGVM